MGLAACESLLQAVPVLNLRLAEPPAVVYGLPAPQGEEVHQPQIQILELAARLFDAPDHLGHAVQDPLGILFHAGP